MSTAAAQLVFGWILDDLDRQRFDALRQASTTLGEGWVVTAGGGADLERVFSPRLGVQVARYEATLDEEEVGTGLAVDLSDGGDARALPGDEFALSGLTAAMKTVKASVTEALGLCAKYGVKLYDPQRPSLSLLAVGTQRRAALVGGADQATLLAQVHANDGSKVVKKPPGNHARLCAWFAS